jgi:pimeloyl-ACP methyl ester carboxylesterase
VHIERGRAGTLPFAAIGAGRPVAVLAGLAPVTGVDSDRLVRPLLGGMRILADTRQVLLFNRRPDLPAGMTMAQLAAEHAAGLREQLGEPVDLVGLSTGGSIAQQLAADHPDVVRRLALISCACRLGGLGRSAQAEVARLIRAGDRRGAAGAATAALMPGRWGRPIVRRLGSALANRLIPTDQDAADLATTIEAEDRFDLAALPPIEAPTLIIAGGRDRFYPQAVFQETAELIPGSQLRIFARRGHMGVLSDKQAQALLTGFVNAPR